MKVFSPNFRTAKRGRVHAGLLISAIILLGLGRMVAASEVKDATLIGAITAMGPGNDEQYSTDDITGISMGGQEAQLSKTALRLPTDAKVTLKLACEAVGRKDDRKSGIKGEGKGGDICDDQDKTSKIFEAAGKATGIPGAYLMCAMATGGESLSNVDADNAVNEMQKNKLGFKLAWKAFQEKLNANKSDSALTKDALTSDKAEDLEARIFGMGLVFRDALQPSTDSKVPGPDLSTLKGHAANIEIFNYLIISHNDGIKAGVDFVNRGFNSGPGHTSVEKCISKVNGIPLEDKKKNE